jgi:hypothetical protein
MTAEVCVFGNAKLIPQLFRSVVCPTQRADVASRAAAKERIMGRLVRKPQIPDLDAQIAGLEGVLQSGIGGLGGMQMAGARPGDNYLERMAKYVPAEIIGASMIINSILEQAANRARMRRWPAFRSPALPSAPWCWRSC